MEFKACMFDYDGTITAMGSKVPSLEIASAISRLSKKMPFAFCTGRDLPSFKEKAMHNLYNEINVNDHQAFKENLHLFAENGSIGYFYNTDVGEFEEFYSASWPEDYIKKDDLFEQLMNDEQVKDNGSPIATAHRNIIVIRTKSYDSDRIDEIYAEADRLTEAFTRILKKFDPDFEKHLHIGNAGIGVLICPAEGDKDNAIRAFGEFLKKQGLEFSENYEEILVVGDQPQYGGNDHYFLNGKYGTPYNVGDQLEKADKLNDVFDKDGNRMSNHEATIFLINNILLNNLD